MKKTFSSALGLIAAFLLIISTAGCSNGINSSIYFSTGLNDTEVFRIGGSVCTLDEAMLFLSTVRNQYEQVYGKEIWSVTIGDKTMEDFVKDTIKEQLARLKCMYLLAEKQDIELTTEDENKLQSAATEYYNSLTEEEISGMNIKEESIKEMYKEYLLATRIYNQLTGGVDVEVSDDEARVITIQYIFIKTTETDDKGNISQCSTEDKQIRYAKMEEYLSQINQGSDFASIASVNNENGEYEKKVKRGDMPEEVDIFIFEMENNEVSPIIQTEEGYYLIKCTCDYNKEDTDNNKEVIISDMREQEFDTIYDEYINTLPSEFNDSAWDNISFLEVSSGTNTLFFDIYNKYFGETVLE